MPKSKVVPEEQPILNAVEESQLLRIRRARTRVRCLEEEIRLLDASDAALAQELKDTVPASDRGQYLYFLRTFLTEPRRQVRMALVSAQLEQVERLEALERFRSSDRGAARASRTGVTPRRTKRMTIPENGVRQVSDEHNVLTEAAMLLDRALGYVKNLNIHIIMARSEKVPVTGFPHPQTFVRIGHSRIGQAAEMAQEAEKQLLCLRAELSGLGLDRNRAEQTVPEILMPFFEAVYRDLFDAWLFEESCAVVAGRQAAYEQAREYISRQIDSRSAKIEALQARWRRDMARAKAARARWRNQ